MQIKTTCTVSIVEDDAIARDGLRKLVEQTPGVQCLSTFGSAEEALQHIPLQSPDLVLMDINLPNMSGIECVSRLKHAAPQVQILMLTVYEHPDKVFQARRADQVDGRHSGCALGRLAYVEPHRPKGSAILPPARPFQQ